MTMTKKRVSICGVRMMIDVPEGYERVLRGPLMNGDYVMYIDKDADLKRGIIRQADQYPSNIEDGWECVFRKVEEIPEPQEEIIDLVIILVIF